MHNKLFPHGARRILAVRCSQVPPEHLQQRADLSGHIAEPVESDLRYLRYPDIDPVPPMRSQPSVACEFGGAAPPISFSLIL